MSKKNLVRLIYLEVIIALAALIFIVVALWNRPLGPILALTTPTAGQGQDVSNLPVEKAADSEAISEPTATPGSLLSRIAGLVNPPSAPVKTFCDGPAAMTILLIGSDERKSDYLYGLADSIHIVRVDFVTPKIMIVDIPRDLWVQIPGISDHYGITQGKLNQAYFYGNPGMAYYDGPGEGPGLLARTIDLNFGLKPDHYLAVDMKTFLGIVDTIGGIDIQVTSKIDLNENRDGENPDLVYEPGYYHLDSAQALQLARSRVPTILQRARFQSMVLRSMQTKLLTPAMIPLWPKIISQFSQSVQTDLSPNDISKLSCIAKMSNKDNTNFVAFPDNMFSNGHIYDPYRQVNTYIMEADFNQIRTYLADFMKGIWP